MKEMHFLILRDELGILLLQVIHAILLFVRIVSRNSLTVLQMSKMIRTKQLKQTALGVRANTFLSKVKLVWMPFLPH